MPIYEYACPDCSYRFEEMQKFSDDPIRVCPKCAASNVKKLVSQAAFVLKGGGWYKDHYGLKSGGEGAAAPSQSEGSPSGSAEPAPPAGGSTTPAATPAPAAPASSTPSSGGASSS